MIKSKKALIMIKYFLIAKPFSVFRKRLKKTAINARVENPIINFCETESTIPKTGIKKHETAVANVQMKVIFFN